MKINAQSKATLLFGLAVILAVAIVVIDHMGVKTVPTAQAADLTPNHSETNNFSIDNVGSATSGSDWLSIDKLLSLSKPSGVLPASAEQAASLVPDVRPAESVTGHVDNVLGKLVTIDSTGQKFVCGKLDSDPVFSGLSNNQQFVIKDVCRQL